MLIFIYNFYKMKKLVLLTCLCVIACNSYQKTTTSENATKTSQKESDPIVYASSITEDELKEHLFTYASDEFEGRDTGAPGQKKAVDYIRETYKNLDIPAAKKDGDYFQKVPLEVGKVPSGSVSLNGDSFEIGKNVLTFSAAKGSYLSFVYMGYGIEEEGYSDYTDMNVEGKIVLIRSGEPKNPGGTYKISGTEEPSVWSNMSESLNKKTELAAKKGAKGILYYDPENFSRYKGFYDYMQNNNSSRMALKEVDSDNFMLLLNTTAARALHRYIDEDITPKVMKAGINLEVNDENTQIDSENVVAIIQGSEKPNEYVVISSHLDHIGVTADGQINNGADDDGSGTVAMLEIAEAFKKAETAGDGPKRSIVFLHVTGEEKGLLGSRYYTDFEPIFPLSQTVANLNIDMIGRTDPKREGDRNYIYLIGSDKLSTELHELSEAINQKYANLELDYKYNDENDPNRFYYRSDHYNFAKNNIPIIFYFNGTHADYHKPTDTPDKINYDLLQNRAKLIFHTAWELANRDAKVIVDKASK
jgi:hypothetical protein